MTPNPYAQLAELLKLHKPKWRGDQPLLIWCWPAELEPEVNPEPTSRERHRTFSVGRLQSPYGTVLFIASPVAFSRDGRAWKKALGTQIEIDGHDYEIKAVEMTMPGYPVRIGEKIGLLVELVEATT